MNELYIKRRAEMLAKEFIDLLIEVEEFEIGRCIDDPMSEENLETLKDFLYDVKKEGLDIENEFSTAFFRMIGFYPEFYNDHVCDNDINLAFLFKIPGVESSQLLVYVIYDKESRTGETELIAGDYYNKIGHIE